MSKRLLTTFLVIIFSVNSFASEKSIDEESRRAQKLNSLCIQEFDISIKDLSVLLNSKSGDYFLAAALHKDGKINNINNLEIKKLIIINRIPSAQGELLELVPTARGSLIINSFIDKSHK